MQGKKRTSSLGTDLLPLLHRTRLQLSVARSMLQKVERGYHSGSKAVENGDSRLFLLFWLDKLLL